ncbi:MAG: DoxX family protein [Deltaproteobacteria bacterium]|nr:DoxX family protein [Deltaproteobacteria bacterium]
MNPLLQTDPSLALLVVRLGLGIIFFAHGAQKVFGWYGGHGLKGTVSSFQQRMGIPLALGVIASFTELLGGLGVLVGCLTRPAALGVAIVMLVAVYKVHWQNGFFLNWGLQPGKGHGFEMNLALIAMALALMIGGGGTLSIDRLLVR